MKAKVIDKNSQYIEKNFKVLKKRPNLSKNGTNILIIKERVSNNFRYRD